MKRLHSLWLTLAAAAGHTVRAGTQVIEGGFIGIVLLSAGAWMAWHPAGFMVAGACLIADRVMTARQGGVIK